MLPIKSLHHGLIEFVEDRGLKLLRLVDAKYGVDDDSDELQLNSGRDDNLDLETEEVNAGDKTIIF